MCVSISNVVWKKVKQAMVARMVIDAYLADPKTKAESLTIKTIDGDGNFYSHVARILNQDGNTLWQAYGETQQSAVEYLSAQILATNSKYEPSEAARQLVGV